MWANISGCVECWEQVHKEGDNSALNPKGLENISQVDKMENVMLTKAGYADNCGIIKGVTGVGKWMWMWGSGCGCGFACEMEKLTKDRIMRIF